MSAADNAAWDDISFTAESIFTFVTPSPSGITTLVSHLSNTTGVGRQWLLGINASGVPMLIINPNDAGASETSISSTFGALTAGRTYYFGASVDLSATNPGDRLTFYLRDMTSDGAFLQANVPTTFTGLAASSAPLAIGSTGHGSSRAFGSIDEIRISDLKLGPNDLLIAPIPEPSNILLSLAGAAFLGLRRKRN